MGSVGRGLLEGSEKHLGLDDALDVVDAY